jgi:hypothetical protein
MSHGLSYNKWAELYKGTNFNKIKTNEIIEFIKTHLFTNPVTYDLVRGVSFELPNVWYPSYDMLLTLDLIVKQDGWEGVQLHTCSGKIYLTLIAQACHVESSEAQRIFVEETGVIK